MDISQQRRFSIAEAAKQTGMSQGWWRDQISDGKICYIQIGKRKFIPEETIKNVVKVVGPIETNNLSKRVI